MTHSLLRCACASLIAVFIGACETDITKHDPTYAHPTTVQRKTARIDVGPFYAGKPNPSDSERIDEFLAAYQTQGERPLEVTVPGKSTDDPAAREHALQLANALMHRGVPAEDINLYVAETQTKGTASVTFPIYVTSPERCGYTPGFWDKGHENAIHPNYGCAIQHNIDAMAANPRDLVHPREMTPGRSGARAYYVIDNYQRGKALPSANDLLQDYNFKISS
ncbi:CpaD family pilus assembly lipoprotein [Dongia deserti]|uniref:CpaD family pilus assembly lipoprotein n=1 Tax=Dongia deserti TaxID=2268030 RepID=UPI0013C4B9C6|nr:CpaD family pilus assembly lipoprotein [Dongia deserti]